MTQPSPSPSESLFDKTENSHQQRYGVCARRSVKSSCPISCSENSRWKIQKKTERSGKGTTLSPSFHCTHPAPKNRGKWRTTPDPGPLGKPAQWASSQPASRVLAPTVYGAEGSFNHLQVSNCLRTVSAWDAKWSGTLAFVKSASTETVEPNTGVGFVYST